VLRLLLLRVLLSGRGREGRKPCRSAWTAAAAAAAAAVVVVVVVVVVAVVAAPAQEG